MPNERSHIRGFLRHLYVKNGKRRSKTFGTYFYKRYMDDTYVKRKRNEADTLFDALNLCHANIKFTLE